MHKIYSGLPDSVLAEDYRILHRNLMDLKREMIQRGYTATTFTRENGQTARNELLTNRMSARTDTIKFHKTQVTTITV